MGVAGFRIRDPYWATIGSTLDVGAGTMRHSRYESGQGHLMGRDEVLRSDDVGSIFQKHPRASSSRESRNSPQSIIGIPFWFYIPSYGVMSAANITQYSKIRNPVAIPIMVVRTT